MPGRYPGASGARAGRPVGMFAAEMFKKADANRDGKVALAEVPAERQESFKRFLARADKDGDKAVSVEEARRAGAAIMARVRAAGARRAMATGGPDMARRAAAVRREAEARRRPAPPTRAAPPARRPGTREVTPEARTRAAEAKAARAKRAASTDKRKARKPADKRESKP